MKSAERHRPAAAAAPTGWSGRSAWTVWAALPVLLALLLLGGACGGGPDESDFAPRPAGSPGSTPAREPSPSAVNVIFLGDSLTAGYGLGEEEAFPALIGNRLREEGYDVEVVNAGVSGDTTAGGLSRLDWLLDQDPEVLVVGLGANDGLRGLPLEQTEENLRAIVRRARAAGARVLLLGMRIPPSHGLDYAGGFQEIFPRVADDLDVPLVPFLLENVAAKPQLNLADRIHPNGRGHRHLAATVYPEVEELVEEAGG